MFLFQIGDDSSIGDHRQLCDFRRRLIGTKYHIWLSPVGQTDERPLSVAPKSFAHGWRLTRAGARKAVNRRLLNERGFSILEERGIVSES